MQLALNIHKEGNLNQLLFELNYALKSLSEEDLTKLFISLIKESFKDTYNNKKQVAISMKEFSIKKINEYKNKGIINAAKDDLIKVKDFVSNLPLQLKESINAFKKLSKDEKAEVILSLILALIIFFAAAGGSDLEGGIPDLDIKLGGIGMHRSIWFHSIIAGLTFELLLRIAYKIFLVIIGHLPAEHHLLWDKVKEFIEKNQNLTIAALWFGIAAHFIKDAGLLAGLYMQTGNFKSYADFPASMNMQYHKAIMNANGLASALIGANNFKKNL